MDLQMVQRTLAETLGSLERDQLGFTAVVSFSVDRTPAGRTVIRLELVTSKEACSDGGWPVQVESSDVAVQTLQTRETASATDDLDAVDGVRAPANVPSTPATASHAPSTPATAGHAPSPAQRLRSRDDSQKRHSLGNISPKDVTKKHASTDDANHQRVSPSHAHTLPNHAHSSPNHAPVTAKHASSFTLPWKRGATAAITKSRDSSKDAHRQPQQPPHHSAVAKDAPKTAKPEAAGVVAPEEDSTQQAEGGDDDEDQDVMISQVMKKWSASRGGKKGLF